ncbi:MAG: hypothetical protein ACRDHK_13490 [Actinomycetota bacterium]
MTNRCAACDLRPDTVREVLIDLWVALADAEPADEDEPGEVAAQGTGPMAAAESTAEGEASAALA